MIIHVFLSKRVKYVCALILSIQIIIILSSNKRTKSTVILAIKVTLDIFTPPLFELFLLLCLIPIHAFSKRFMEVNDIHIVSLDINLNHQRIFSTQAHFLKSLGINLCLTMIRAYLIVYY